MSKNVKVFKDGLVLFTICFVIGLIVSFVYNFTAPKIEKNKQNETFAVLSKVFDSECEITDIPSNVFITLKKYNAKVYKAVKEDKIVGYCADISVSGYKDNLNMLVVINESGAVERVEILNNEETPSLGTKVFETSFLNSFKGITAEFEFSKDEGGIKPVSSATITSNAVKDGINVALKAYSLAKGWEETK